MNITSFLMVVGAIGLVAFMLTVLYYHEQESGL